MLRTISPQSPMMALRLRSVARSWMGNCVFFACSRSRASPLLKTIHYSLPLTSSISEFSTTTKEAFTTSPSYKSTSASGPKVFVKYTIYKGKAALRISPRHPTFRALDGGNLALDKEGCIFIEFAPAVGQRQYDWNRKQVFALSVVELGSLICLQPSETVEFFHDPFMGSNNAGKVRKTLKVEAKTDQSGYFFCLSVADSMEKTDERFMVPVSRPEMTVMRSSFNFIIPYLMGWHVYTEAASSITDETISETPPASNFGASSGSVWED